MLYRCSSQSGLRSLTFRIICRQVPISHRLVRSYPSLDCPYTMLRTHSGLLCYFIFWFLQVLRRFPCNFSTDLSRSLVSVNVGISARYSLALRCKGPDRPCCLVSNVDLGICQSPRHFWILCTTFHVDRKSIIVGVAEFTKCCARALLNSRSKHPRLHGECESTKIDRRHDFNVLSNSAMRKTKERKHLSVTFSNVLLSPYSPANTYSSLSYP